MLFFVRVFARFDNQLFGYSLIADCSQTPCVLDALTGAAGLALAERSRRRQLLARSAAVAPLAARQHRAW